MRRTTISSLGLIAILAAACTSAGSSVAPSAASPSAVAVVSTAPSVAPSATPDACAAANLTLATPGKFTIGTDNPAYPPYFAENADKHKTAAMGDRRPDQWPGLRERRRYAIADRLGFDKADVAWIVVPFANSFAPGTQDVRHRPQPGQLQDRAHPDRRPVEGLLLRQSGARRPQGQPPREGDDHRRAEGLRLWRPGRDDQLRLDRDRHRADEARPRLRHQ